MKFRQFPTIACVLLILWNGQVLASTEIVSRQVTGQGETRSLAIADALIEGIRQVHGISISTSRELRTRFSDVFRGTDSASEQLIISDVSHRREIRSRAGGFIQSYELIDVYWRSGDSVWEALVIVQIPKYKSWGQDRSGMRTLAVLPFRSVGGLMDASKQLHINLVTELTQSRRFRVLDRDYLVELEKEQEILASSDVTIAEQIKIGERLGTDYMVVGQLINLDYSVVEKKVFGVATRSRQAILTLELRVIEVPLQEVRWASVIRMNLGNDDLMKIEPRDGERETISGVMAHAATLAAEEIVETIYPIRILDLIDDGNVALSQGGKRISESSLFNVYAPARRVTDKDTGRVTRVDGPWVALVKVTRVLPKFSLAKVVDGDYSAIQERAVCRRLDSARGSGIEITPSASINW